MEGLPILKEVVECSVGRIKYGTVAGHENILVEVIEVQNHTGINRMKKMYGPKSLPKSIFVTLPGKAGATE